MRVPRPLEVLERRGAAVRPYRDGNESAIVVDFGTADAVVADVVGRTVIVASDDRQLEFELPDGARSVSINNGVLTISE